MAWRCRGLLGIITVVGCSEIGEMKDENCPGLLTIVGPHDNWRRR